MNKFIKIAKSFKAAVTGKVEDKPEVKAEEVKPVDDVKPVAEDTKVEDTDSKTHSVICPNCKGEIKVEYNPEKPEQAEDKPEDKEEEVPTEKVEDKPEVKAEEVKPVDEKKDEKKAFSVSTESWNESRGFKPKAVAPETVAFKNAVSEAFKFNV